MPTTENSPQKTHETKHLETKRNPLKMTNTSECYDIY